MHTAATWDDLIGLLEETQAANAIAEHAIGVVGGALSLHCRYQTLLDWLWDRVECLQGEDK